MAKKRTLAPEIRYALPLTVHEAEALKRFLTDQRLKTEVDKRDYSILESVRVSLDFRIKGGRYHPQWYWPNERMKLEKWEDLMPDDSEPSVKKRGTETEE